MAAAREGWMRRFLVALALVGVAVVAGATVFLLWDLDWRWRPHTITRHEDEIAQALAQSGWVSPHLTGPALYMISFRACPACIAFEASEFPKLQKADVDTRVIMIALPDSGGAPQSTPAERATVAELWTNRSWRLFQQWSAATPSSWTAPGVPPADGDAARTAVVEVGRKLVSDIQPQLAANGVTFAYPLLAWRAKDGRLRAVAGAPRSWRFVEHELAADRAAP